MHCCSVYGSFLPLHSLSKSNLLMCVKYLALAPIPQVLFSEKFILKTLRGYAFGNLSLFCQYGTRLVLIFQSCEQLKTRVSIRTLVWFTAPVYLFLYLTVSHVIGASWYYLSIKRQLSCWNYASKIITGCIFPCDGTTRSTLNSTLVNEFCPLIPEKFGIYLDALQSGIVEDKGVLKKFLQCFFWGLRNLRFNQHMSKYLNLGLGEANEVICSTLLLRCVIILTNFNFYCSSFGSNLHSSTNNGETFFAIIISTVALILFIYIIGNIQRYAGLESARSERIVDEMKPIKERIECLVVFHNLDNRTKKSIVEHIQETFENGDKSFNLEWLRINHFLNDVTKTESVLKDLRLLEEWVFNGQPDNRGKAKKWLSDNNIPHDQNNILFYLTCRLKDDEDVNLTSVLSVLPDESKWMTMKDLCFDTLKKVQGLQNIDEEWFKSISTILKPVFYPKESCIFRQGEPLDFIIFITKGIVTSTMESCTVAGGSINSLEKGDFFGGELLQWKLEKIRELGSSAPIATSTADVKSHTQVEAFVLKIEDLNNWTYPTQVEALSSDFPVESASANSVTEGIGSSRRTEEGGSKQIEIKVE